MCNIQFDYLLWLKVILLNCRVVHISQKRMIFKYVMDICFRIAVFEEIYKNN